MSGIETGVEWEPQRASALDHPIVITTFRDAGASTKRQGETTLRALMPILRETRAATKADLPWLKLAAFGDARTDKGSLRHNSNIIHIYGIEADYDGEQMTLSRARQIIGSAGLAAILYTSPSHTADRPRWRVLCPTSKPLLGSERAGLLSRLNGLFLGALADESFVLSQSYYYGAIHGAPDHTVIAIDGGFIDHAHHLNAGALGRSLPKKPQAAAAGPAPRLDGDASPYGRRALENECHAIRTAGPGQKHHTLNRAAYSVGGLVSGGHIQEGFAFRELSAALNAIASACDDFDHAQRTLQQAFEDGMAAPRSSGGRRAGGGDESRSGKVMGAEARPEADEGGLELTEDGVALVFGAEHKDALRYCHGTGGWYVWTGSHWKINRDKLTFCWARALVRNLNRQADFKTKAITGKASFAAAVEKFAQADRAFAVTAETWDRDLYLIGTPGGTVDLRTGQLRAADRADHITKIVAVAPAEKADCPNWLAFLKQATADDADLIRFLQQWAGYSLSGSIREQALMFLYGPGGNGKSVFLNTLAGILADYVASAAMDTFTSSPGDKHPTDLAMLRGARLVTATETEEGRAWAEARIKQMTGGDPVTARFMRMDFFTYTPQFKLAIAGNHKPALKNVDDGARRRFNIVPFLHKPEVPDHRLEHKLKAEWPGILRWMIEGCLDWQKNGLVRPKIVTDATAEYFAAQDTIGRWMAERCIVDGQFEIKPGLLLADCRTWANENGETPPTPQQFRSAIEKVRGVRYATVRGIQWIKGIGCKVEPDARQGGEGGGGWR